MNIESTIYIVDDDDAVRDSLQALLGSVGLRSEAYASGNLFIEAHPPPESGAVLLDLNMPGLSGLDVLKLLSAEPRGNPIIVITGHAKASAAARAIKEGAVAVLQKPLQKKLLIDTIWQVL